MSTDWDFEVFYDGDCPLCVREIRMLQKIDRRGGRVLYTDIASPDFRAQEQTGVSFEVLMAEIHGRLPSGELVVGMDVFRGLYGAVGWGFVMAPTGWPGLRMFFDFAYRVFARNRLRLTGRCSSEEGCDVAQPS